MSQEQVELLRKAFPDLPENLLAELAQKVQKRTYPIGTVLCKEGEIENTFYIICSGRVVVSKLLDSETSRILTYQGPGDFFGELGLIHETQRAATVITLEETQVLELNRQDFMAFLESSTTMVTALMRAVASRLRDADQRSIAELRRKNIELSQAYHALEAETRQRSEFLTTVAHELRTPLTTVKGYLDLLDLGQLPHTMIDGVVDTLANNVDAIVQLMNNILFLQEIELIEPHLRPVDAGEVVSQAMQAVRLDAERVGLSLHQEIDSPLEPVMGDPGSLKQAIVALLENAVKFSPNGGEIFVDVRSRGQFLEINVRDPGIGIPAAQLDRLFDRIQHQDATGAHLSRGVGLGLPIAKAVVEQHKGSIHVTSEEGKGSTFTIRLPISSK